MKSKTILLKYKATFSYIVTIVLVNMLFSYLPFIRIIGKDVSPADTIVGAIYIVRDFAQREIGHYVILAMLVGAGLSYCLADQQVAYASLIAFLIAETIDWMIFTFTRKPLSERLLWSSLISAPIDTYIFLAMIHHLNWLDFTLMSVGKFVGVLAIWAVWHRSNTKPLEYLSAP